MNVEKAVTEGSRKMEIKSMKDSLSLKSEQAGRVNKDIAAENSYYRDLFKEAPDRADQRKNDRQERSLHETLLEEYLELDLLNRAEAESIRDAGRNYLKQAVLSAGEDTADIADSDQSEILRKRVLVKSKFRSRMLELIREKLHAKAPDERPVALCLSGGGIRSATFCLGVLQGLARNGLFAKFDYLSTVSGGGYIGSWLSAWLYREGSIDKVTSSLSRDGGFPYLFGLNDLKYRFDDQSDKNEVRLRELRDKLAEQRSFFDSRSLDKIIDRLEALSVSCGNPSDGSTQKYKIGRDLCRELNDLVRRDKSESEAFREEVEKLVEDERRSSAKPNRLRIKRRIIEEKLKGCIVELDEFEHIEPPEITYLRSYSNFMSPRPGLFSVDTWTLVAIYLRNLLLNWTIFLPILAAIILVPKILATMGGILAGTKVIERAYILELLLLASSLPSVFAVIYIIFMRPSFSHLSPVNQHYRVDAAGTTIGTEKQVLLRCVIPLLIAAFCASFFWAAVSTMPARFAGIPMPAILASNYGKLSLFVIYYEILFLGGFAIAHGILEITKRRLNTKPRQKESRTYRFREFLVSIVSGALGGVSLNVFADLLHGLAARIETSYIECLWTNRAGPSNCVYIEPAALHIAFGPSLFLVTVLLSTAFFVGIAGKIYDDMDREWLSRLGAWLLIAIIGWTVFSSVVLFGETIFRTTVLSRLDDTTNITGAVTLIGTLSGLVTLILGFSRKSPSVKPNVPASIISRILKRAPQIAAPIFALFLLALISFGTSQFTGFADQIVSLVRIDPDWRQLPYLLFCFVSFLTIGLLMGRIININKFSLHAMYRDRLTRAYLGASRSDARIETANSFTDLDALDNLEMCRLDTHKPFHVVNMTLNLGKPHKLRWQNRKAESFTATALYCGSSNMVDGTGSYRPSSFYGSAVTLGTVAAISGAAVSPNMGYYSMSASVSFLMALFNLRLGWWLGNPGVRGEKTFDQPAPRFAPGLLIDEALGDTGDTNPYVYLSDGGHFENLGLYEMVLRRCHCIVACDAGADSRFGFFDLGTAIHKIRVDMGIPIEFISEAAPEEGANCAIARIRYSTVDGKVDDGYLIYIKPTLDGDEPIDVVNYKSINPDFPHETTGDEFYSETQFESYRSLGFHMINSICKTKDESRSKSVLEFANEAQAYRAGLKGKKADKDGTDPSASVPRNL